MRKFDLGLDYNAIRQRIEIDKADIRPSDWARKVGVSLAAVSNIHSPGTLQPPSLQYVIAVARATGKPLEWYLYGELQEAEAKTSGPSANREAAEPAGNISRQRIHTDVDRILDSGIPEYIDSLERTLKDLRYQLMHKDLVPDMAELRSLKAKIERIISLQEVAEYRRKTPQAGEGAKQKKKRKIEPSP